MHSSKNPIPLAHNSIVVARLGVILFVLGMLTLHLLPSPTLVTRNGIHIPYDPRLNFMSEYVRTQYGSLMTFNFCMLSFAAAMGAWAFRIIGNRREATILAISAIFLTCLAVFPTDLAVMALDGHQCDIVNRVEPCTRQGFIHNLLPPGVFGSIGFIWLSLKLRKKPEWNPAVNAGWVCLSLAILLLSLSSLWLLKIPETHRYWAGLSQRSIVIAGITWMWILFGIVQKQLGKPNALSA